jgi:hypothetical protein
MEVLGRKEALSENGQSVVVFDVTHWTLLGLCLDGLWKVWARSGAQAVGRCDIVTKRQVKISRVVKKGGQSFPSPGVEKWFDIDAGTFGLANTLLQSAQAQVATRGWRVFAGDLDLCQSSGRTVGAVDGAADRRESMADLAFIELKTRKLRQDSARAQEEAALCSALDQRWTRHSVPRLSGSTWTHGIAIVFWQASYCRSCQGRDVCNVVQWSRGNPPRVPAGLAAAPKAAAKATPKAAPKAVPKAAPRAVAGGGGAALEQRVGELVRRLKARGAVERPNANSDSEWCQLPLFLHELELPVGQAKRDYLTGKKGWRLEPQAGRAQGRKLVEGQDFKHIGRRKGGGTWSSRAAKRKQRLGVVPAAVILA